MARSVRSPAAPVSASGLSLAIAAFLSRTVPDRLAVIEDGDLPQLSRHLISLRVPGTGMSAVATELARHIREGFDRRYSDAA